jgi:hypothetical protein
MNDRIAFGPKPLYQESLHRQANVIDSVGSGSVVRNEMAAPEQGETLGCIMQEFVFFAAE